MAITTLTCFRIDCDTCHQPLTATDVEFGEFPPPHFAIPDEALTYLHGDPDVDNPNPEGLLLLEGEQLPDGRFLCGGCNTDRLCAERGHRFTDWGMSWSCDCDPWSSCGHQARHCRRNHCGVRETRTAVTAA